MTAHNTMAMGTQIPTLLRLDDICTSSQVAERRMQLEMGSARDEGVYAASVTIK
jgi:hypothetical protein